MIIIDIGQCKITCKSKKLLLFKALVILKIKKSRFSRDLNFTFFV